MIGLSQLKEIWKDFKDFSLRANFIEVCVGLLVGSGLTNIANSFIKEIAMPILGILIGNADFSDFYFVLLDGTPGGPYRSLSAAKAADAVVIRYGAFLNTLISFMVVAWVVFWVVRLLRKLNIHEQATIKCPMCVEKISAAAKRCPHCTSKIGKGVV